MHDFDIGDTVETAYWINVPHLLNSCQRIEPHHIGQVTGLRNGFVCVHFGAVEFWLKADLIRKVPKRPTQIVTVNVTMGTPMIDFGESSVFSLNPAAAPSPPPRHFPAVSMIAVLSREAARKRRFVGEARKSK